MNRWQFLALAMIALVIATGAFIGATVLDAPWLRFVGLAALAAVAVGHEAWRFRGAGRQWLIGMGALLAVVGAAFVLQKLVG